MNSHGKRNKPEHGKSPDKTSNQRKETLPDWATDTSVPLTKLEESIYKEWYASKERIALTSALTKRD